MLNLILAAATAHGAEHADPSIGGIIHAPFIVAASMTVVLGIMLWKKVPGAIGKSLDKKIAAIRDQLAEAEALRKEAEALKAEYEKKAKESAKDAKAMLARAEADAEAIVAKASEDAAALVERRKAMAEAKIAAEERAALAEIKASVATAAAAAAASLIADKGGSKKLVDDAIAGL